MIKTHIFLILFFLMTTLAFAGGNKPITLDSIENTYSDYLANKITAHDTYTLCKRIFDITTTHNIRIIINDMLYTPLYCEYMNKLLSNDAHQKDTIKEITKTLTITAKKIIDEQNKPIHPQETQTRMITKAKSDFCYFKSPLFINNTGRELLCIHEKANAICSTTGNKCIIYTHISENETYIGCALINATPPTHNLPYQNNLSYLKYYKIHQGIITPDIHFFDEECNLSPVYPEFPNIQQLSDDIYKTHIFPK